MIGRVLAAALAIVLLSGALARAEIVVDPDVTVEHFKVLLNGVSVAADALVYVADDGVLYASKSDIDAWKLEHPLKSTFSRNGRTYYGLQTDLKLAATVDRRTNTLEIVAQRTAFVGEGKARPQPLTPGTGAYLNYQLQREFGDYDFFAGSPAGVFEMRYLSTAGAAGLEFHRSRTRWFHLDALGHYVVQAGDWNTGSDPLIDSIPFAGLHLASEYRADQTFVTHGLPTVRGIANAPSLVEVYVDNILQLRQEVLAGPFTIDDLPAEAADTDVVLVITDARGNRTVETVRPNVDPSFLGHGIAAYVFDGGIVHRMRDQLGASYRGSVYSGSLRYGITDTITGSVAAQSTAAQSTATTTFGDLGFDIRLGDDHLLSVRTGAGGGRRASTVEYALGRGKFRFSERLTLNSEQQETFDDLDPFNVVAQIRESTGLQISASRTFTMGFNLDRARENNGYDASLLTAQFRLSSGASTLEIRPLYNFVHHLVYGGITFSYTFGGGSRVTERGDVSPSNTTSGALEYAKGRTSPDDPIDFDAKASFGDDRRPAPVRERRDAGDDRQPAPAATQRNDDQRTRAQRRTRLRIREALRAADDQRWPIVRRTASARAQQHPGDGERSTRRDDRRQGESAVARSRTVPAERDQSGHDKSPLRDDGRPDARNTVGVHAGLGDRAGHWARGLHHPHLRRERVAARTRDEPPECRPRVSGRVRWARLRFRGAVPVRTTSPERPARPHAR